MQRDRKLRDRNRSEFPSPLDISGGPTRPLPIWIFLYPRDKEAAEVTETGCPSEMQKYWNVMIWGLEAQLFIFICVYVIESYIRDVPCRGPTFTLSLYEKFWYLFSPDIPVLKPPLFQDLHQSFIFVVNIETHFFRSKCSLLNLFPFWKRMMRFRPVFILVLPPWRYFFPKWELHRRCYSEEWWHSISCLLRFAKWHLKLWDKTYSYCIVNKIILGVLPT